MDVVVVQTCNSCFVVVENRLTVQFIYYNHSCTMYDVHIYLSIYKQAYYIIHTSSRVESTKDDFLCFRLSSSFHLLQSWLNYQFICCFIFGACNAFKLPIVAPIHSLLFTMFDTFDMSFSFPSVRRFTFQYFRSIDMVRINTKTRNIQKAGEKETAKKTHTYNIENEHSPCS